MNNATLADPETDSGVDLSRTGNSEIAALAYRLWTERGCPVGSPDEDWFLAEVELTNQHGVSVVAA